LLSARVLLLNGILLSRVALGRIRLLRVCLLTASDGGRLLDVAKLGLLMVLRVLHAGADEEGKVDNGQNPEPTG